jgi:glycerol-3-phosphate dehydrogenase (NAD(P)+)
MQNTQTKPIAVLGAGSWGTALALHLARSNEEVRLWSYDTAFNETLKKDRINARYLPDFPFPTSLQPVIDLEDAIKNVKDILIAVPSTGFRDTLLALKPLLDKSQRIVWATKGMDSQSQQLLHDLAHDILGDDYPYAVLSGPSYAKEVAAAQPTAVVIASTHPGFAQELVTRFNHQFFRTYLSRDIIGVEVCGVVKNVLAIAIGISDGMGFGANARSALITRGLAEMTRLGLALGAKIETFSGLAGIGDLVLTCTDNQSRNRRFGLALGQGKTAIQAEKEIQQVVEGKRNVELIIALAHKHKIEMPIAESVLHILQGKCSLQDAMKSLLAREPKSE